MVIKGFTDGLHKSDTIIKRDEQSMMIQNFMFDIYKLNGEKVVLLHNNKKIQRSIYTKGKGKTKYCKINNEFILLSKLKNKVIE